MVDTEAVKAMLKEIYNKDDSSNKNKLDYLSWQIGFQRGMEYQQKLDNRVIKQHESAKEFIYKILGKLR